MQIRMESDMRLRLTEEAKMLAEAKQSAEKKVEALEVASVSQDAARQRLEQERVMLRMDLERAQHDVADERNRAEAEKKMLTQAAAT